MVSTPLSLYIYIYVFFEVMFIIVIISGGKGIDYF